MNIIPRIIWRIILHYPIYPWDIQPTSGYVRAQKNSRRGVNKFEKGIRAFLLLLFPLDKIKDDQLV